MFIEFVNTKNFQYSLQRTSNNSQQMTGTSLLFFIFELSLWKSSHLYKLQLIHSQYHKQHSAKAMTYTAFRFLMAKITVNDSILYEQTELLIYWKLF